MNKLHGGKMMAMRQQMSDILLSVSWGQIAHGYFGKSASWLYHRMDGYDDKGNPVEFSREEVAQLKGALYYLADRIRCCTDCIKIQTAE